MEPDPIYTLLNINLYKNDNYRISVNDVNGSSNFSIASGQILDPNAIASGSIAGDIEYAGGSISSANFITSSAGWRLSSDGSLEASDGTFRGNITATSGEIGGFTIATTTISGGTKLELSSAGEGVITSGTFRSAASGTRLQITDATQRLEVFNANGDVNAVLNWSSTTAAILKLAPIHDARRALEIIIPASFAGAGSEADAKAITIANAADSICIDITDGGLVGLQIAGCDTSAIKITSPSSNAATIDLTGVSGSYPAIDIVQSGTATDSYGIRIVQAAAAIKEGIYIDDNASSHLSESIYIDRDSNSASNAAAIKINSDNAGAGEAIGIDFSGSSAQRVINVATDNGAIGTYAGRITIAVAGVTKFVPYYNAP